MNNDNKESKKMSFFQIPKLDKEGKLSPIDALNLYRTYLTSFRINHEKQSVRPIRSSIYKQMCKIHDEQTVKISPIVQSQLDKGGRILFWSDQHFYHTNIIKFSNRPFESVEHMNSSMLTNYFENVLENDVVVFGGDVAFGEVDEVKSLLQYLPGIKVLVLGNHEFGKKNDYRNYDIFDATEMCFVFYKMIDKKMCNVLVTHYPIDNKYLPPNTINIHGHIHVHLADMKNINMAVEHTQYVPKDLSFQIEEVFLNYC